MRAGQTPARLPDDVLRVLSRAVRVERAAPTADLRFVVEATRPQAEALHRWLLALLDELSPNDDRRLTCLHTIDRIAVALRLPDA
jgi:hypothetical protein